MFKRYHLMILPVHNIPFGFIASVCEHRQVRLASLRQLQSQTQTELDALLPSVLDRAFKGEL